MEKISIIAYNKWKIYQLLPIINGKFINYCL